MAELLQLTELTAILQELGENVKRGYINKLVLNGHPTRENTLASTVGVKVVHKGTTYSAVLRLQEYWKYVEYGTKPHWPPPAAIARWIEIKPVQPYPDSRGRIPTPKQLTYLISRKIARFGTKGTHELQQTKDVLLGYYKGRIKEALKRDVFDYIQKINP